MADHAIRILLVEDNPGDARLLRETLRDAEDLPTELTHVDRLDAAIQRVGTRDIDVVLLDLSLPDSQGNDTVRRLTAASPHMPTVVLTGTYDEALGIESVRLGAQDFLVKGQTDPRLLTRAIRYAIERKRAEELLQQANAQLEQRVAERTGQLAAANDELRAQMDAYQRLEAEVSRLVEAERVHLGMELHDNLCQQLAATGMLTSSLVKRLREQESPLSDLAHRIGTALSQTGADAHAMARGLLPVQVEADGLMMALATLAQRTGELQAVTCEFVCATPVPVPNNTTATYLFRMAQEAIHNAINHGHARRIVVTLTNQDGVSMTIADDGTGIPPEKQRSPGSGLRIMAYRARVIGATLTVERAAEGGTRIQCVLKESTSPQ
jgi:signal transduction histidine kinase